MSNIEREKAPRDERHQIGTMRRERRHAPCEERAIRPRGCLAGTGNRIDGPEPRSLVVGGDTTSKRRAAREATVAYAAQTTLCPARKWPRLTAG